MRLRSKEDVDSAFEKIATKAISKAVKIAKTFVVLKWTKKVKALKDQGGHEDELEVATENLQQAKSINHVELGAFLTAERFPHLVHGESPSISYSEDIIKQITTSKQYSQSLEGLEANIKKVVDKKSKGLKKSEASKAAAEARKARATARSSAETAVKVKKAKVCTSSICTYSVNLYI